MKDFSFYSPTRILFGQTHLKEFAKHLGQISKKVLIVCGKGSIERLGYLALVSEALIAEGVELIRFDGVEPNPTVSSINAGARLGKEKGVSAVLAFGGGSVMDASKAMACLIYNNENDIWPYVLGEPKRGQFKGALPIVCIPTTAATASEVTPYAVISKPDVNGKAPIAYEFIKPTLSWINPAFTTKLPQRVTQDGAADILSHVFENYLLGGNDSPLCDRYCEGIISTVIETLPLVLNDLENYDYRARLLWCSTLALNGMHSAGRKPSLFPLHAIEHAMSGVQHELAHGRGLATLFIPYFKWLWAKGRAQDRLNLLGKKIFNVDDGAKFIDRFELWLKENDLFQSTKELGIKESQLEQIAQSALNLNGDSRSLDVLGEMKIEDIIKILG